MVEHVFLVSLPTGDAAAGCFFCCEQAIDGTAVEKYVIATQKLEWCVLELKQLLVCVFGCVAFQIHYLCELGGLCMCFDLHFLPLKHLDTSTWTRACRTQFKPKFGRCMGG